MRVLISISQFKEIAEQILQKNKNGNACSEAMK